MARRLKALHLGRADLLSIVMRPGTPVHFGEGKSLRGSGDACSRIVFGLLIVVALAIPTALAQDNGGLRGAAPESAYQSDQASFADIDGDGRPDLVLRGLDNEIGVHLSTGSGFTTPVSVLAMGGDHLPGQAQFADVNGDGRSDLVFRSVSTSCNTVANVCGQRRCVPALCSAGQVQLRSTWCTESDCRRDDICTTCRRECRDCDDVQSIKVGLSSGASFATPEIWIRGLVGDNGDYDADQVQLGDLNGDGRADLVFRAAGNTLKVSLSTGTGFSDPEDWISFGGDYYAGQLQLADLNGDGKSDAIFRAVSTVCSDLTVGQRHCNYSPLCPAGTILVRDSGCVVTQHSSTEDITKRWTLTCQSCSGSGTAFRAAFSTGTGFTPPEYWPADRGAYSSGQAK